VTARAPWGWNSKVSDELLRNGLGSTKHFFSGRVLDIGCGKKPYRAILGEVVDRWLGLDFPDTASGRPAADVFGSAMEIPFAPSSFDTVLSTQVLEHVACPERLIREAHRVLKPGGHFVLTAPQTNPLHEEPNDYFRYTCYGLKALSEDAGFQIIDVRPLGGAIATVGQMIIWHLNWLRRIPAIGLIIGPLVNAVASWAVLKLDRLSPIYGGGATKDTLNWLLIARKPGR
jgi:SAM-dependent methyltransferase